MKKIIIATITILFCIQTMAQKYLDVYQGGKVVNSIATIDIDSIGVSGSIFQDRIVKLYRSGNVVNQYYVKDIDSIKVFREEDEQLVYLGIVGFNHELYEKDIGDVLKIKLLIIRHL